MNILINIATRERPEGFQRALDSVVENVSNKNNITFIVTADEDDTTTQPFVKFIETGYHGIDFYFNTQKERLGKIGSINAGPAWFHGLWDVIINLSDDMIILPKDFDLILEKEFNGDYDQCLHLTDGATGNILITMAVMGRVYWERTKYIYNPEYKSLFCDGEMGDVARLLGKYKYVDQPRFFSHIHPVLMGNHLMDALYEEGNKHFEHDKEVYFRRKKQGFGVLL